MSSIQSFSAQPYRQHQDVTSPHAQRDVVVEFVTNDLPPPSFLLHFILACSVTWCCGCLVGIPAFVLALVASDKASSGFLADARAFGRVSLIVSIVGIVLGLISIIVIICLIVTSKEYTTYQKLHASMYHNG